MLPIVVTLVRPEEGEAAGAVVCHQPPRTRALGREARRWQEEPAADALEVTEVEEASTREATAILMALEEEEGIMGAQQEVGIVGRAVEVAAGRGISEDAQLEL